MYISTTIQPYLVQQVSNLTLVHHQTERLKQSETGQYM